VQGKKSQGSLPKKQCKVKWEGGSHPLGGVSGTARNASSYKSDTEEVIKEGNGGGKWGGQKTEQAFAIMGKVSEMR